LLAVQATLATHVAHGNTVYHGVAGPFLLGGLPGVLKVRVVAPLPFRVRQAVSQLALSREEAVVHIQNGDKQREKWVKALYEEDWSDPSHYHVILNLGDMSIETAADIIACMLQRKEYVWSEKTKRAVADFALQNTVRAHLRFRSQFAELPLNVQVRDGVVRIAGDGSFETSAKEIVRFVSAVPGVERVVTGDAPPSHDGATAGDRSARDLMLPLDRYPHVTDTATLREAFIAVGGSAVRLDDGHLIAPRYLLVFNQQQELVGILSRRDMLRGLVPGYRSMKEALATVQGVLHTHAEGFEESFEWASLFGSAALENAKDSVRAVMVPPKALANAEDSVSSVVSAMLLHNVDLVPVLQAGRVVGVVLMTDIFDTVAQHVVEQGGR
jgi:CBS domain-containing protein